MTSNHIFKEKKNGKSEKKRRSGKVKKKDGVEGMSTSPVCRVCMEFAVVVEGNGGTNDKSIWEGQISARAADVTEVLLSLTTVKNVMVSMNEDSYHWTSEVPAGRVKGRTIKWVSKSRGREELSIEWKLGIRDDGYVPGQVTYAAPEIRTCARSVL